MIEMHGKHAVSIELHDSSKRLAKNGLANDIPVANNPVGNPAHRYDFFVSHVRLPI
jgi:hypothetical protein